MIGTRFRTTRRASMWNEYGSVIASGAAWVGKPFRGDPGFYWQDATDPEATHHGPYDTFDQAEQAARSELGITHDE